VECDVESPCGLGEDLDLGIPDLHPVRVRREDRPSVGVGLVGAAERDVQIDAHAVRRSHPDLGVLEPSGRLALGPPSIAEPLEHFARAFDVVATHEQVDVSVGPRLLGLVQPGVERRALQQDTTRPRPAASSGSHGM
jgi:hypothetical protein